MVNLKFYYKLFGHQIRFMSKNKPKNHYESLGVPSTSTQGEIKSAYYKLSMVYHPDKNPGNLKSSQRFRDITEAYEVLANVKSRKLYDKGLYFGNTSAATADTMDKFHKSRTRTRPPTPTGRTPVYDFDEWSKSHYAETFRKHVHYKKAAEEYNATRHQKDMDKKTENIVIAMGLLFLLCTLCLKEDLDVDTLSKRPKDSK